jgi:WD40 repeat protein/tetratricopeptide (TPR) repeat protein
MATVPSAQSKTVAGHHKNGSGDAFLAESSPVEQYRYAAFISYRHVEPDRRWAQWLHRTLETYRVPRRLRRDNGIPARLGRCFRDEEELPASADLSAQIDQALTQSRYLIVVCSSNTPQSRWVNQEVARFRQLGRGDRILTLLIDGEPRDAFPEALVQIRRSVMDASGNSVEHVETIEPLAADVRKDKATGHGRQHAKLRLIATMLGVNFDDLRRRDQERRQRRLVLTSAVMAVLLFVITGLAALAWVQRGEAQRQRADAQRQRDEANRQRVIADRARMIADGERQTADKQRAVAEDRLSQSLISQGNALLLSGRGTDAAARFSEARGVLLRLGRPTVAADLGWFDAFRRFPPPTLRVDANMVESLVVGPDSRTLILGSTRLIEFRDLTTARRLRHFSPSDGKVFCLAVSPDGHQMLSGSEHEVEQWNLETGELVRVIPGQKRSIFGVAFEVGGKGISVDGTGEFREWDLRSGTELRRFRGSGGHVWKAAFSPDGALAWAGGNTPAVRQSDVIQGQVLREDGAQYVHLTALTVAPDSQTVIIALSDGSVSYQEARGGKQIHGFHVDSGWISAATYTSDGRGAWLSGSDGMFRQWDLSSGDFGRGLSPSRPLTHLTLSPDGRFLVGGDFYDLNVWDLAADETPIARDKGTYNPAFAVVPNGQSAFWSPASGVGGRLIDLATAQSLGPVDAERAAFSRDGMRLAADRKSEVCITPDSAGKSVLSHLPTGTNGVSSLAWHPDGRRLLVGGYDGSVRFLDSESGQLLHSFSGHIGKVNTVEISPDGRLGLSASMDSSARMWDLATGREVRTMRPKGAAIVTSARFSPDGKTVLTSYADSTADLWDVATGRQVAGLRGHTAGISDAAFSADGRLIATAGAEGAVRLWDAKTYAEIGSLSGYGGDIRKVAFASNDGLKIVCIGNSGWLVTWDLDHARQVAAMVPQMQAAVKKLTDRPDDAIALAMLGEWYAMRGAIGLAIDLLGNAEARGYEISHLTLARCYWRDGRLKEAAIEFDLALSGHEAPEPYLTSCLEAVGGKKGDAAKLPRTVPIGQSPLPSLPDAGTDPAGRVLALLRRGQFNEADAELARAIEQQSHDDMLWYRRAALRLYLGDVKGYHEVCREMLRQFGAPVSEDSPEVGERTVEACLLSSPDSHEDLDVLGRIIDRVLQQKMGSPWLALAKGISEYRAGRYESAIQWLTKQSPASQGGDVEAKLFLAMSQQRAGHAIEADDTLQQAERIMRSMPQPGRADLGEPVQDWLICQAVRREAEAVVSGHSAATRSSQ